MHNKGATTTHRHHLRNRRWPSKCAGVNDWPSDALRAMYLPSGSPSISISSAGSSELGSPNQKQLPHKSTFESCCNYMGKLWDHMNSASCSVPVDMTSPLKSVKVVGAKIWKRGGFWACS